MLNKLLERRKRLKQVKSFLNRFTPLETMQGRKYLQCLVLLTVTEMKIEQEKSTTGMSAKQINTI